MPISNCINSGIKKVFILTQFLSASMHRHIMQTYAFDTFTQGFVDILAAEQTPDKSDWFQGTSDAVRVTLNHTMYYQSDQILILGGDHLYRMDYEALVEAHREAGADITLGVYPVTREEAPRMGLMKADATGEVTEIEVRGNPCRVFASAPPTMRALWELAQFHGDKPYVIYESDESPTANIEQQSPRPTGSDGA